MRRRRGRASSDTTDSHIAAFVCAIVVAVPPVADARIDVRVQATADLVALALVCLR